MRVWSGRSRCGGRAQSRSGVVAGSKSKYPIVNGIAVEQGREKQKTVQGNSDICMVVVQYRSRLGRESEMSSASATAWEGGRSRGEYQNRNRAGA
eukprot:8047654-Pyramimonas_sp.AAC.1